MTTSKTFPKGGIHPSDHKLSAAAPIQQVDIPERVFIPLSQHIGAPAKPLVKAQDKVKTGQLIAETAGFISANIHSSVTGTVEKIDDVMSATGYKSKAIIIKTEPDQWTEGIDLSRDLVKDISSSPEEITQKVLAAGVVGLGGATFPTHVKLSVPKGKTVEFLLINGAECEPYLTADHRLMLEKGPEIMVGIAIMLKALGINKALIGIEDNKPDVIQHLEELSRSYDSIQVFALKTHYPQGGERQLVKALVNREIPPPPKGLPIDVGCVVQNVGTVYAVYEAVQKNKPLIERVVTVTGTAVTQPSNFLVRIGTSVATLFDKAGGLPDNTGKVISGGPMMGRALNSLVIPVTKGTSGLLALNEDESKREEIINCIRCGKCVMACPLGLEPYLLMALVEKARWDQAEKEKIVNCCECACCAFICPAHRPLLDYIRLGKNIVLKIIRSREQNEG